MIPQTTRRKSNHAKGEESISDRFAPHLPHEPSPELAQVIDAWPHLPETVRAGIVAMVKASAKDSS